MGKRFAISFSAILLSWCCFANSLEPQDLKSVVSFIQAVKTKNPQAVGQFINYPLEVDPLLQPIKDKSEFAQRFSEIFDQKLIDMIVKSDPNKDWDRVGSRGIMYGNGEVWLNDEGKLIGVNYQTKLVNDKRQAMIDEQKKTLHSSLQTFVEPILDWQTKNYRVRVDRVSEEKYRLALWPADSTTSSKPQLVIGDGSIDWQGSGGNHDYNFKQGALTYSVVVDVLGEKDANKLLKLSGENEVFAEPVITKHYGD